MIPSFGEVGPPFWDDATAFLLGGGPSLTGFDFNRLLGLGHICAVNQAMFGSPCECGVTVDHSFVRNRVDQLRDFAKHKPLYLCLGNEWWKSDLPEIEGAIYLQSCGNAGISRNPRLLNKGATSGYLALGVAVAKRAREIVLLGYDYKTIGGAHHYHNTYPWHHNANDQSWSIWARRYGAASVDCRNMGIKVFNASLESELECFPKISLEDALRRTS